MQYSRIVINEPHASIEGLYDERLSFWNIDERFVNDIVLKWTDWHTDYLFHGCRKEHIRTVRFPYSRFIVDAERLWNDPLEAAGQGILYKLFDGYSRMIPQEQEAHLMSLWHQHQERLRNSLCADALLLDCHSFPDIRFRMFQDLYKSPDSLSSHFLRAVSDAGDHVRARRINFHIQSGR